MTYPYFCTPSGPEKMFPAPSLAENKDEVASLRDKRVVVVEDEGITQLQLRKILTQAGLHVVGTATTANEGIETVLRERPDLVLMDIHMPGDLSGLEAAEQILAAERVCIIMLTAYSEEEYQQQARQIGTCGYVIKPISRDVLFPQIEAAFRKFQAH